MFIIPDLELIETSLICYGDASVRWVFDTNSSVVCLEASNKQHVSSEHWISENSDIFSFTEQGDLACLRFSVPGENYTAQINIEKTIAGRIKLHKSLYSVPQTTLRLFDPKKRRISCFMAAPMGGRILTRVNFANDLTILLSGDEYFGFELSNPLDYLATKPDDPIDHENRANDDEYLLMSALLEIISDNTVEALDNDMAEVANELKTRILPQIEVIKSPFRKAIIESSLEDFIDYYA